MNIIEILSLLKYHPVFIFLKEFSQALFNIHLPEFEGINKVIDIEFNDITMKTKLVVRLGFLAIRLDQKTFCSTILGCTPHWNYKNHNEYVSQKIINSRNTNKIRLKFDVIDGSVVKGLRQPMLFSCVLHKQSG